VEPTRNRMKPAAAAPLLAGLLAGAPAALACVLAGTLAGALAAPAFADESAAAAEEKPVRPEDRKTIAAGAAPDRTQDTPNPWPPGKRGRYGGWWDHYRDSDDQTFDDFSVFLTYKQVYTQIWSGDYTDGIEIGGYLRDKRRSTYGGFYRFRDDFDHVVQLETAQVLPKGFVAVGSVRFIHVIPDDVEGDRNQIQFGAGFDWYHGDYDFLTFRAISDPREGGRWTFLLAHRWYLREDWLYIEPAIMPRTDGSTNWYLKGKVKYFVWLVGDFNQFDFTDVDRKQFSIGLEIPY
jgi:hypothetical protein